MDLWYYFFHRGLELLRPGGVLSFIVSAYWTSGAGAEKLVRSLREEAHLDEIFLLDDLPIFPGVASRHSVIRVTKGASLRPTMIRRVPPAFTATAEDAVVGNQPVIAFEKRADQLFRADRVDLESPADELLATIDQWPSLGELGVVRQGIAENPAAINAKTNAAFGNRWQVGEGVFALRPAEVKRLALSTEEKALLRPYYDLCDVARYGIAERPSLQLVYSTKDTCPDIARYPRLQAHLERFRPVMEARRETRKGTNRWWHLHWPREERIWQSPKILALQFARRPAFVPVQEPACLPFSINVFAPSEGTQESLDYLCGLLNCRLLWKWYQHLAKRRGVGLEINGRVLARTPIRRIDFSQAGERALHDQIAELARNMIAMNRRRCSAPTAAERAAWAEQLETTDRRLDRLVYDLYCLTDEEVAQVERSTA
jgi:adenine-specific DNA-methyltransferase